MEENKEKYRVEFSEQARKDIDRFQTEADDKTLMKLQILVDKQITNIGFWPSEEEIDIDITFDNKYLLDLLHPEFYHAVDKVGEEYLWEEIKGRDKIQQYLSRLPNFVLKEVDYDPEEGLLLTFYDEGELKRVSIEARGWILEEKR